MPKVTISREGEKGGHTSVYINGVGRRLPHDKTIEVSDAELEVLQNASDPVDVKVLKDSEPAEADPPFDNPASPLGGDVGEPATPADTSPGRDRSHDAAAPAKPVIPDLGESEPATKPKAAAKAAAKK